MSFQAEHDVSHDDAEADVHARLERLFVRRAQKAESYCRILLTTRSRPMAFDHGAG